MGLFDIFGGKSPEKALQKAAKHAANKRAQAVDRWEAIQELSRMGTTEAVEALLPRFTFYTDPSITDAEEKDAAFNGVVGAGEAAVAPVMGFLERSASLAWPLKMLDRLRTPEQVLEALLGLLQDMDTEYERDPEKKLDVLAALAERKDPSITEAVSRFLEDVNETARFNAIGALLNQDDPDGAIKTKLVGQLGGEESMRVKVRILEACRDREWQLEPDQVGQMPNGWALKDGLPNKG